MKAIGYMLAIETSGTSCSAALLNTVTGQIDVEELHANGYTHAENLHVFLDVLMKRGAVETAQIQGVLVSSGPGSYTGLRIGVSAAKGLAFALDTPLFAVGTLQALCAGYLNQVGSEAEFLIPTLEARRGNVYAQVLTGNLRADNPPQLLQRAQLKELLIRNTDAQKAIVIGGSEPAPGLPWAGEMQLSARWLIDVWLNYPHVVNRVDLVWFEPDYISSFQAIPPKKNIPGGLGQRG